MVAGETSPIFQSHIGLTLTAMGSICALYATIHDLATDTSILLQEVGLGRATQTLILALTGHTSNNDRCTTGAMMFLDE